LLGGCFLTVYPTKDNLTLRHIIDINDQGYWAGCAYIEVGMTTKPVPMGTRPNQPRFDGFSSI